MNEKKFVTAINCMDGRVQLPVIEWMKQKYNADYVDMITEPGPIKILTDHRFCSESTSLKKRVEISLTKHASQVVAVVGHHDCAGNPADKETQILQIKAAVETIRSWGFSVSIIGLWVDDHWMPCKII